MMAYALYLFGRPRIIRDNTEVSIGWKKAVALLIYLSFCDRGDSRDTLSALLWPNQSQDRAYANLRNAMQFIRKNLGADIFDADRSSVSIKNKSDWYVDVHEFRHLIGEKDAGCAEQELLNAYELYKADFLAGFNLPDCEGFDSWQRQQADTLWFDHIRTLRELVVNYEKQEQYGQAVIYAHKLIDVDPLDEDAHREIIQSHHGMPFRLNPVNS